MKDFNDVSDLREHNEVIINKNININEVNSSEEIMKFLHEMEIYKTELEMQNEALLLAKENAENISQKYKTLYDYAPMAYFAINREGLIIDVNHAGEILLGKEKNVLLGNNYQNFVNPATLKEFKNFIEKCMKVAHVFPAN
jgi:PAS domain-containing protein